MPLAETSGENTCEHTLHISLMSVISGALLVDSCFVAVLAELFAE